MCNQWPKGPISILQWGPKRGKLWQLLQKIDIFYQTKIRYIKKGYGTTMISNYTTHTTLEYIKLQNTSVIGAQDGGKLSPFVMIAVR